MSVSSTSLSMTLPISCQICLGKVREPVVCPNQHVFCSNCMDTWLRSHSFCPTCRTSITAEQPCKKIIGSIELPVNSDAMTRAELRRTRLDLIRQEYEDEVKSLQNTVERLKSENKQLHEKMIERERAMASMDLTTRHRSNEDGAAKLDIDMLVKLTTRLQEASHASETLRVDMDKIKQENKKLQEDNKILLRENTRLKDEPKFSKSPQRYSHYSVAGLQSKVSKYEREVQQLRRALQRSDNHIEDLTNKLETACGSTASKSKRTSSSPTPSSNCWTLTSLVDHKDANSSYAEGQDAEKSDLSNEGSLADETVLEKKGENDLENTTSVCHSPVLAPVGNERFPVETGTLSEEQDAHLSSRRSSEVSLYGQDLDIPAGPLTKSLNILEPIESEAVDRPPSRGELLLLGDRSSRRQEKPPLEENLNMFTASRQLIMLSERRQRQREGLDPSKLRDPSEYSPSSSDGGKRKSPETKSVDFDLLVNVTSEDSSHNSTVQGSSSNVCRVECSGGESPGIHTFSLAKIKSEIELEQEDQEMLPKKPRMDNCNLGNSIENSEQELHGP